MRRKQRSLPHSYVNSKFEFKHKSTIFLVLSLFTISAFAIYCPPQYVNEEVQPVFKWSLKIMTAAITEVDSAFSGQLQWQSERLISAIAILTKQKAVAANQISDGSRNTNENIAVGLNALSQAERVKKARFDYGGDFGQGYSPCYVFQGRLNIARSESDMSGAAAAALRSEIKAAPGRYANPVLAQKEMLDEHNKLFCTAEQANSGLCSKEGPLPGASLNAATLFSATANEDQLTIAKKAFINNIAGLPDGEVPLKGGGSEAAAAYQIAKIQKDAVRSSSLASFKQIQLETTSGAPGEHSEGSLPLSRQYANEVKRYSGNTAEYKTWTRVMSAQNERGLLVDLLKIKALDLSMQERQFRQWERMEALLASAVAVKLKTGQSKIADQAADTAIQQSATSKIGH